MILINIILQNPLLVLLISTIASWVLITQVWEPFQKRLEIKQNLLAYQSEVFSRLAALEMGCNKKWSNGRILDFLNGNVSVNRNLREWKISCLVHNGWSDKVYQNTIGTLLELEKLANDNHYLQHEEKTKKSKQLLVSLQQFLKNQ